MRRSFICLWAFCLMQGPVWASTVYEHALLIGVSRYADPEISPLPGVPYDMASARQIANAMGIPDGNIRVLLDAQATKANIATSLQALTRAGTDGGKVLLYFSGHGTRWADPQARGCVEGLLTYDRQVIVNREWAELTRTITERADRLIVMFDACHSRGVTGTTRSLSGGMRPKFFLKAQDTGDLCSQPVNLRTRSLLQASTALGALRENVVHISSSRPDEVSFDEPEKGGLATQGVRDCLLGKAKDLDGSGGISLAEVEQCAQHVVREKLKPHPDLMPHHVGVSGFRNLVPVPVRPPTVTVAPAALPQTRPSAEQLQAEKERLVREERARQAQVAAERAENERQRQALEQAALQAQADERLRQAEAERLRIERELKEMALQEARLVEAQAMTGMVAGPDSNHAARPDAPSSASSPLPPGPSTAATSSAPPPPAEVTALATLRDLEEQRDRRHKVTVKLDKPQLRIGQDALKMRITAPHDGHVYIVMVGSDERSFYVLFPNALDNNNRVRAGQTLRLPGPAWELQAAGPAGTNQLLVMVTRQPRSLDALKPQDEQAGISPFLSTAADASGRQQLQRVLLGHGKVSATRFSAQRIAVQEIP